jgi:hypothetical protein
MIGNDEYSYVLRGAVQQFAGFWLEKKGGKTLIRNGSDCLFSMSCVIF